MPNMSRRSIHSNTDDSYQFSRGPSECDLYETANTAIGMEARETCGVSVVA